MTDSNALQRFVKLETKLGSVQGELASMKTQLSAADVKIAAVESKAARTDKDLQGFTIQGEGVSGNGPRNIIIAGNSSTTLPLNRWIVVIDGRGIYYKVPGIPDGPV